MRIRIGIFALTALLLLQACASQGDKSSAEAAEQAPAPYVAEAGLTDKERFRKVLYLLEQGEPESARVELLVYLQDQPNSQVGQDLLEQIDLPATTYFPEDYREIQLQSGVSLPSLSQHFLGSVYKFHALAKYNGIAEPGALTTGEVIRIPLTPEAREAFVAQERGVSLEEQEIVDDSTGETEAGYPKAVLETEDVQEDVAPVVETAAPVEAGSTTDVEKLYREALNAYRAQDLDKAITLWDQVLAIDPDYETARLYRSQAIGLKEKLNSYN